jgi:hypothetical protein
MWINSWTCFSLILCICCNNTLCFILLHLTIRIIPGPHYFLMVIIAIAVIYQGSLTLLSILYETSHLVLTTALGDKSHHNLHLQLRKVRH